MAWTPNYVWNGGYNPGFMPQMPVQAPQSVPQTQVANNPTPILRCIPVTSKAEVEVFQIPFDGSTTYFTDTSNGKIYTKTFDFATGKATPVTYVRESEDPVPQYATIEDLNALRDELLKARKAVKKNDTDE